MNALIHRIGIRLQLMLWYTAVFAALLLFSGAFFYQHLEHSLEASLDTTLEIRAQQIAGGITWSGGTITIRDMTGDLPGFDANPNDQRLSPVDVNNGARARLLDAHGRLLHETPALQSLALTLNEMLDSLDQAFSSQRRFVADASHELRTPVAVIRNKTDVARLWAKTPQDYVTVLEGVNAEAERLGHLISDLLALARGDEGRTQFDPWPVPLDPVPGAVAANRDVLAT